MWVLNRCDRELCLPNALGTLWNPVAGWGFFKSCSPWRELLPGKDRCRAGALPRPGSAGSGGNSFGHVKGSGLVTTVAYGQELPAVSSSLSCVSCPGVCVWGL